ncbi:MAG: glycosyltransferase family 9 protein [Alphaproteobacteria bacterium]|nr:glycosyltransferase family 9 protein [Alphaproteobacteria bacterium]
MNILFITASRIGDAVLSTGLLNHITREHPNAKVTIVCGPLAASLFEGYPQLERVIPLKKQKRNKHWIELWRQVVGTRWDMVVDLRNSAVSRLIRAKARHIYGRHIDRGLHKAQQNAAVMKLDYTPDPKLWFSAQQEQDAAALIPDGDRVLGVGPTANWLAKTWPADRFIEVIANITAPDGMMPGARVAVFAAPGEEETARAVLASVPVERQIDVIAKTDPGTAAACLSRCDFYIGNDSGLMHCAAAAGTPTLGLFGPSYPHIYAPWGDHTNYARTPESFDELIDYQGYSPRSAPCLMESLSVDMVLEKLAAFKL